MSLASEVVCSAKKLERQKVWAFSCSAISAVQSLGTSDPLRHQLWNSPSPNIGMGSLSLLQGIFPTQRSNPGLPDCRWIFNQLSHKGSPGILEWVAYPFSRGSSQPRNGTQVSCIARGFFTIWAIRERMIISSSYNCKKCSLYCCTSAGKLFFFNCLIKI